MALSYYLPGGAPAPRPVVDAPTPESRIADIVAPQTFSQLFVAIACLAMPLGLFALFAYGTNQLIDKTLIAHIQFDSLVGPLKIWKDAPAVATDLVGRLVYFGSYALCVLTGFVAICASGVVISRFFVALVRDVAQGGLPRLFSLRGAQGVLIVALVVIALAAAAMLVSGVFGYDGFGFGAALARSVRLYDLYGQAVAKLNPDANCPKDGAPFCTLIAFSQFALNMGICAALLLSVAAAAISYRWPIFGDAWHDPNDLRRQRRWLIALFVLGSALLVFGTSSIRAAEDWALGVYGSARSDPAESKGAQQLASVAAPQHGTVSLWLDRAPGTSAGSSAAADKDDPKTSLKKVTDALSGYWSVFSSIILLSIFIPAFWRLQRDVEDAARIGLATKALCEPGRADEVGAALTLAGAAKEVAEKALQDVHAVMGGPDPGVAARQALAAAASAVDEATTDPIRLAAARDALRNALTAAERASNAGLEVLTHSLGASHAAEQAAGALGDAHTALWRQPRTTNPTREAVTTFLATLDYDDVTKWKEANGVDVSFSQVATAVIAAAAPLLANSAIDLAKVVSL